MRTPDDYHLPERPMEPAFEAFVPTCPVCGAECETIYTGFLRAVIGCDVCVDSVDAYDYMEQARKEWRKLVNT